MTPKGERKRQSAAPNPPEAAGPGWGLFRLEFPEDDQRSPTPVEIAWDEDSRRSAEEALTDGTSRHLAQLDDLPSKVDAHRLGLEGKASAVRATKQAVWRDMADVAGKIYSATWLDLGRWLEHLMSTAVNDNPRQVLALGADGVRTLKRGGQGIANRIADRLAQGLIPASWPHVQLSAVEGEVRADRLVADFFASAYAAMSSSLADDVGRLLGDHGFLAGDLTSRHGWHQDLSGAWVCQHRFESKTAETSVADYVSLLDDYVALSRKLATLDAQIEELVNAERVEVQRKQALKDEKVRQRELKEEEEAVRRKAKELWDSI